jgi:hypothetical protein
MSERHWPRPALATTALALLGATAVAGCGGGSASSTGQASATETAGVAATTGHQAITAGCAHYTATVQGKTFHYSVQETPVTGLANQARALNVKAAGYAQVDVWSVVYRADGFVGAVTMVGPDATEASVKKLATQAYQYAAQTLA